MLQRLLELFRLLDFIPPTADHVEPTPILKVVNLGVRYFHVVPCEDTLGSIQKPEQLRVLVSSFDEVIDPYDHIVTTGSLASRQHTADSKCIHNRVSFGSLGKRHTFDPFVDEVRKDLGDFGENGGFLS